MEDQHPSKVICLEKIFWSYMKRNPKIKMRKACPLERKRAKITKDDIHSWFHQAIYIYMCATEPYVRCPKQTTEKCWQNKSL